jgi:hypothetical protein
MNEHQKWQMQLEAAAAESTSEQAPLSEIDLAVRCLCEQYSEADLQEPVAAEKPQLLIQSGDSHANKGSVEQSYQRLLSIAGRLREQLSILGFDPSREYIEESIDRLRVGHDSDQISGLASSIAQSLAKLKVTCESCAQNAEKPQGTDADLGQLFLLTAESAGELRQALSEVYDC